MFPQPCRPHHTLHSSLPEAGHGPWGPASTEPHCTGVHAGWQLLIAHPLHISSFFFLQHYPEKKSHLRNESDFQLKIPNSDIIKGPKYQLFLVCTRNRLHEEPSWQPVALLKLKLPLPVKFRSIIQLSLRNDVSVGDPRIGGCCFTRDITAS